MFWNYNFWKIKNCKFQNITEKSLKSRTTFKACFQVCFEIHLFFPSGEHAFRFPISLPANGRRTATQKSAAPALTSKWFLWSITIWKSLHVSFTGVVRQEHLLRSHVQLLFTKMIDHFKVFWQDFFEKDHFCETSFFDHFCELKWRHFWKRSFSAIISFFSPEFYIQTRSARSAPFLNVFQQKNAFETTKWNNNVQNDNFLPPKRVSAQKNLQNDHFRRSFSGKVWNTFLSDHFSETSFFDHFCELKW